MTEDFRLNASRWVICVLHHASRLVTSDRAHTQLALICTISAPEAESARGVQGGLCRR